MKLEFTDFRCKYCNSRNIIKYGHFRGVQRYFCKDCNRKFADNDALPNMKTSVDQIGSALSMYYEGMSLNAIRRHQYQTYNNYPSDSTIYEWVKRFTKKAISEARDYRLDVGDVWIADETVLKIDGGNVWFWDIIDAKTRFLLASHVSKSRNISDAKLLMESASRRAGKVPKFVITDRLASYIDGIEQAFGADAEHIQSKPFTIRNSTNLIERFHGTLKSRTKVMRGLKEIRTAKLFTDGWLVHYNFLRPHESLKDKTPAEKAGVKFPFRNWLDIVKVPIVVVPKEKSVTSVIKQPTSQHAQIPFIRIMPIDKTPRKSRITHRKQIRREIPSLTGIRS